MMCRSYDNTRRGRFHQLELEDNGDELPLTYKGRKLPISFLETYHLKVTPTNVMIRDIDANYYEILHRNSELTVTLDNAVVGKVKPGQPAVVGANMNKKQSPAPLCYVDEGGAINSVVLSDSLWSESVMGYTADGKPNTYAQGFVPSGSAEHDGLFLRKDGQWGRPSPYVGSVSNNLLSLTDTPLTYQGQENRYLRVSYAEGGSIVFDSIDTSKVPESLNNLYYTEERVESKITEKTSDRSLKSLLVQNTVTARDFLCDSDRRLKENIQSIDTGYSLERVLKLKPKTYNFKGNSKNMAGLISQEVFDILPDLVDDTGKTQKLNYVELIPHLIGCISELHHEILELKKQLLFSKLNL
jgi:hypothetical protein